MKKIILIAFCSLLFLAQNAGAAGRNLQDMGSGVCQDQVKGLQWQISRSHKRFADKAAAKKYVADLRDGGHDDWRLPAEREMVELYGLLAIQGNDDCHLDLKKNRYWIVSPKRGPMAAKMELDCLCSGDINIEKKSKGYIRAVRNR